MLEGPGSSLGRDEELNILRPTLLTSQFGQQLAQAIEQARTESRSATPVLREGAQETRAPPPSVIVQRTQAEQDSLRSHQAWEERRRRLQE